jgi:hypothetical protein
MHFKDMMSTQRGEDFNIKYRSKNRFSFFGNGVTQRDVEDSDLASYLKGPSTFDVDEDYQGLSTGCCGDCWHSSTRSDFLSSIFKIYVCEACLRGNAGVVFKSPFWQYCGLEQDHNIVVPQLLSGVSCLYNYPTKAVHPGDLAKTAHPVLL